MRTFKLTITEDEQGELSDCVIAQIQNANKEAVSADGMEALNDNILCDTILYVWVYPVDMPV